MTKLYKTILIIETLVAFVIPMWLVILGLVVGLPLSIMDMVNGSFDIFYFPLLTIGGFLGLWGIAQLSFKLVVPDINIAPQNKLLFYIGCGCLAYSPALAILFEHFELLSLLYLFPYVVTFQLLYANRHSIFSS